jgi:O-acetyl-ADP-ribose deacetylase (regulator of RNase III)
MTNVTFYDGDLFDSTAQVLVHQVNAQGVMGSGVAKQVKDKYPHVFELYRKAILCDGLKLGQCQLINAHNPENRYIGNLVGQDIYGYDGNRYTNYEAFYTGLESLKTHMELFDLHTVAFPYNIGCDRGGANWSIILSMITAVFSDPKYQIEIWKYNK